MNSGTSAETTVLTSWKDIARYMGKGVRTVQRWERDFGLPVRRPQGSDKKAILARPRDLDAWVAVRCSSRAQAAIKDGQFAHPSARLISLQAEMETARMLRDVNDTLLKEVRAALDTLRRQIMTLQSSR